MWYKAMKFGWYFLILWTAIAVIECIVFVNHQPDAVWATILASLVSTLPLIATIWLGAWKNEEVWSQMPQIRKFFLGLLTIPNLTFLIPLLIIGFVLKIFGGAANQSIARNEQRSIIRDGVRDALNDKFR